MDWQLSYKAARSPKHAQKKISQWLEFYAPDIIVTENLRGSGRKGDRAKVLIQAVKDVAEQSSAQHIEVERSQPFASKYDQIEQLCDRYPQMKSVAPVRRKFFEKEPPRVTIFEALAMAEQITL